MAHFSFCRSVSSIHISENLFFLQFQCNSFLPIQLFSNFPNAIWIFFLQEMNFLIKIFNKLRWCVCVSIEEKESSIEVGFYAQARHLLHPFFSPPLSSPPTTPLNSTNILLTSEFITRLQTPKILQIIPNNQIQY